MRNSLAALALTTALVPFPGGGGAHAAGGGSSSRGSLNFVPMEEVTVPIIEADRVAGSMRVKLVLEASTGAVFAKARAEMPRLREATIAATLEFARINASSMRAIDAGKLDRDLNAALRKAEPGLSRVLIVEVAANHS